MMSRLKSQASMTHELKCLPASFSATLSDRMHHQIRWDDRGYQVGDELLLREWIGTMHDFIGWLKLGPEQQVPGYTGRRQLVEVTCLSRGPDWGLPIGMVVMSIERRSLRELP